MKSFSPNSSYNDSRRYESELHHLFMPSAYTILAEGIVAVIALLLLNFTILNEQIFSASAGISTNPLSVWGEVLDKWLPGAQSSVVQRILLFALWSAVGALLYIFVFRIIQMFVRTRDSLERGGQLIQAEHAAGAWNYLQSLHDFFIKLVVVVVGLTAIFTGALLCFAIASQELSIGLNQSLPDNIVPLLISLVGALLGVRVIVVGLSLLSPRFRDWYNA